MLDLLKGANLVLAFLLELCALGAFGYWGFTTGSATLSKIGLGIGAPLLAAVVWGIFVAPCGLPMGRRSPLRPRMMGTSTP